jgi:hypothetical protein
MDATNKTDQPSPWVVYEYEVDMFKQTWSAVDMGALNTFPHLIRNCIVESMLLHLRALVDMLLSRGSDADDIKLTDLLPDFKSPLTDELRSRYGNRNTVGSPCWTLNKMLTHAARLRSASYNLRWRVEDYAAHRFAFARCD